MQALVEYSSGEGSDSENSDVEEAQARNTTAPQHDSHDSTVVAAPRGLKRCFDHVEGQWAATVMILGVC